MGRTKKSPEKDISVAAEHGLSAPVKSDQIAALKKSAAEWREKADSIRLTTRISLQGLINLCKYSDVSVQDWVVIPLLKIIVDKFKLAPALWCNDQVLKIRQLYYQRANADDERAKAVEMDISIGDPDWQKKMAVRSAERAEKQIQEDIAREEKEKAERRIEELGKKCKSLESCNRLVNPLTKCIGEMCPDYNPNDSKYKINHEIKKEQITGKSDIMQMAESSEPIESQEDNDGEES